MLSVPVLTATRIKGERMTVPVSSRHNDASEWADLALLTRRIARQGHIAALRRSEVELLPPTLEEVLRFIVDHPRCRVQDVARSLMYAPSNASSAVGRLEAADLVEKSPDAQDRRVVRLVATDRALSGRRILDGMWIVIYKGAASALDAEERATLRATLPLLKKMADAMTEDEI
ncbi:MarR family winged helix-turn-helix transcriptional regulator [Acidipropionibacterium jensenii]|uniref:MarR family winged helix-turn-helix transcriptional regulator n=2 Tax=Acidipropionibacterium jensenii TaxID=1749 RepID=UPI001E4BD3BE|nr:MarR family transcriptional regulator [Acidipropionibacterium jensenii]MDN6021501.1 MarR family transcriptional regulator [Acidipropionibacterium jensenii]MDN6426145.1 MarR family transcriptional regulator [Acidipropionibacterium jensenii]MDN6479718.1 MarR family transcriptional regulator [Acidipropionibacterium jensenii]MDN6512768.1 MarR family transcriptional regulator [Acidipropionibacterium jensenii]MDN6592487.1 MarR family transcriptional regulator [Acidipropionibacterium jensenii]